MSRDAIGGLPSHLDGRRLRRAVRRTLLGVALQAADHLPPLLRPGAEVREVRSNPGVVRRTTEVRVVRIIGGVTRDLGSYQTRLGPLGTSFVDGAEPLTGLGPRLSGDPVSRSTLPFDPDRLGDGVAATVELA